MRLAWNSKMICMYCDVVVCFNTSPFICVRYNSHSYIKCLWNDFVHLKISNTEFFRFIYIQQNVSVTIIQFLLTIDIYSSLWVVMYCIWVVYSYYYEVKFRKFLTRLYKAYWMGKRDMLSTILSLRITKTKTKHFISETKGKIWHLLKLIQEIENDIYIWKHVLPTFIRLPIWSNIVSNSIMRSSKVVQKRLVCVLTNWEILISMHAYMCYISWVCELGCMWYNGMHVIVIHSAKKVSSYLTLFENSRNILIEIINLNFKV